MPQLIQNGDVLSGTSNDSANILYSEPDGNSKNVQEKIEELDSGLEEVNNSLKNIGIREVDFKLLKAPSLQNQAGQDISVPYTVPSGWSILTIIPYSSGSWAYKLQSCGMSARTGTVTLFANIFNCATVAVTETTDVYVKIILVKNLIK